MLCCTAAWPVFERMVVLGVYQRNWQRLWDLTLQQPALYAAFGPAKVYIDEPSPSI